jgi:hypothetical protein
MGVSYRLAGRFTHVDADVVAVGAKARFDVLPHLRHEGPQSRLFLSGQDQEVGLMPPGNNKTVPGAHGIRVRKGDRQVVRGYQLSTGCAVAEGACHGQHDSMSPALPRWLAVTLDTSVGSTRLAGRWWCLRIQQPDRVNPTPKLGELRSTLGVFMEFRT